MAFTFTQARKLEPEETNPMNALISRAMQSFSQGVNLSYLPRQKEAEIFAKEMGPFVALAANPNFTGFNPEIQKILAERIGKHFGYMPESAGGKKTTSTPGYASDQDIYSALVAGAKATHGPGGQLGVATSNLAGAAKKIGLPNAISEMLGGDKLSGADAAFKQAIQQGVHRLKLKNYSDKDALTALEIKPGESPEDYAARTRPLFISESSPQEEQKILDMPPSDEQEDKALATDIHNRILNKYKKDIPETVILNYLLKNPGELDIPSLLKTFGEMTTNRKINWGDLAEVIPPKAKDKAKDKVKAMRKVNWGELAQNAPTDIDFKDFSNKETGWSGVGHDVLNKGIEFAKGIPGALMALPGEAMGAGKQFADPSRLGKNLFVGGANLIHGAMSTPGNIRDYLVSKDILSQETPSFRPPESLLPRNEDYGKPLRLGKPQPGDALIQGIPAGMALSPLSKVLPHVPGLRDPNRHIHALENALEQIEQTKKGHAEYLGHGQAHKRRAANEFMSAIEGTENNQGLRQYIGSQYDALANEMAKESVSIAKTPDMKLIKKEIAKLGKGVTDAERENLAKIYAAADSKRKVSGADALIAYREAKHQAGKAYKEAFTGGNGLSPKVREEWIKKGDEFKALEQSMQNMLNKQLGTKYLDKLKIIDKEYATKIAPLYENELYQEMLKHGQSSKNIMEFLHGTTKGNDVLNMIVEGNPELQRLIVGQKFAKKPQSLLEPEEMLDKYKKLNPRISQLINEQKQIKNIKNIEIPELEKKITKAREGKLLRRGLAGGAIGTAAGGAGLLALETALGRDWKKDAPLLASLLTLKRSAGRK